MHMLRQSPRVPRSHPPILLYLYSFYTIIFTKQTFCSSAILVLPPSSVENCQEHVHTYACAKKQRAFLYYLLKKPTPNMSIHSSISPSSHTFIRASMAIQGATMASMMDQKIQDDWTNREFIELIAANIKRIADFLNKFGTQSD